MELYDLLLKKLRYDKLLPKSKGYYVYGTKVKVEAGPVNVTLDISFLPMYFSESPLVSSTSSANIKVLEFKKSGNAVVGAKIQVSGNFDVPLTFDIIFQGDGGYL